MTGPVMRQQVAAEDDLLDELRDVEDYFKDVDPNPIHLATVQAAMAALRASPPAIDLEQFREAVEALHAANIAQELAREPGYPSIQFQRMAQKCSDLMALIDGQGSSCALPAASAKALHEAVAAIYFNDSSDYLSALWQVVRILDPSVAHLLERDESAAYDQTASALKPTKGEGDQP